MTVALDATYSIGPALSGIGVYSRQLITHLGEHPCHDRFLLCYRPRAWWRQRKRTEKVPGTARLLQWPLPLAGASVFHALNQRLDHRYCRRTVATFHDLFVLTGEYSTREFRERFIRQAKRAVAHADLLISISEFTARQLTALLRVERSRIRVIPHGVDPPAEIAEDYRREDLVLSVGVLQRRKNLARLVRAFSRLPRSWRLVLAGASTGFGAADILQEIAASPARDRIELAGYVDQPALHALYQRARIFSFPSLDEGFGIPVLEAMAYGVPVLTSNRSALPEVAGDAALLVDPEDEEQLAQGLQRLAIDPALRDDLRIRARLRAAGFGWQRTAALTSAVYHELGVSSGS